MGRDFHIGFVTDELSRNLEEALTILDRWGIARVELREGSVQRYPDLTASEISLLDSRVAAGLVVTAVSPGVFKSSIEDSARVRSELQDALPRSIELAQRLGASTLITFGFERMGNEGARSRTKVLRAFEAASEQAAAAGMIVAVENEPSFWIDRPAETAEMLRELDHPALRLNWDPANLHWGGLAPDHDGFDLLRSFITNVHVKDFTPDDPETPWRPLGRGITPWTELTSWIVNETDLWHATIETHCEPLLECSQESLDAFRRLLDQATDVSQEV